MLGRIPSRAEAAVLIGLCVVLSLSSFDLPSPHDEDKSHLYRDLRRHLTAEEPTERRRRPRRRRAASTSDVYPWAERNLVPLSATPDPTNETPLFWHVPKSGGTTVEDVYQCLGLALAHRVGGLPKFGHDKDDELTTFQPWKRNDATYVNVDTSTRKSLMRAQKMGLVSSGLADLIMTGEPRDAVERLYDEAHKGRLLGMFRHPVDRLVSKFYYLQVATWERTYSPRWKDIDIYEFATEVNNDNNIMLKKLAGKRIYEDVDEDDLQIAKRTVRRSLVVGIMDQMGESIRRFNVLMGLDESEEQNEKCMSKFFGGSNEKKNSNSHPQLEESDPAWSALAEKNALDIELYEFMLRLFNNEQKEMIDSYAKAMASHADDTQVE